MARRPKPSAALGAAPPTSIGHVLTLLRETIPPLHPAGRVFVAVPAAFAVLGRRSPLLRRTGTATALACAAFFREPHRVPPQRPGLVVAAGDGTVALIDTAVPPRELGMAQTPVDRVSIFLSVLDVHVQRSPVAGTVRRVAYQPGRFASADLPEASESNERKSLLLHTDDGHEVAVVQIAGLIARRIVCDLHQGDRVERGQTYGMIRFGSRVDTYLPPGSRILVEGGQRMVGAESVLAELP